MKIFFLAYVQADIVAGSLDAIHFVGPQEKHAPARSDYEPLHVLLPLFPFGERR